MKKVIDYFVNNIKKIIMYGIGIEILFAIYCYPISLDDMKSFIKTTVLISFFFYMIIIMIKTNNFTGATEIFDRTPWSKYAHFVLVIPVLILTIVLIIRTIITREFIYTETVIPTIIGLYCASRATQIYEKKIEEVKKESTIK